MKVWLTLPVSRCQKREFGAGGWRGWVRRYPMLFDDVDKRLAKKQAARGYYFYEWLSAVTIYEMTGYRSLVIKYASRSHEAKWRQFNKMVPQDVLELVSRNAGKRSREFQGQGPDLFVYKPGTADWYFVEVKGPTDKIRPSQAKLFKALENTSERPVKSVKYFWLPSPRV